MAAHIICRFRHLSEKQKIINRIIDSSNSWSGINDLRSKYTSLSARDLGQQKNPTAIGSKTIVLKNSSRRLYHKWSALVQK